MESLGGSADDLQQEEENLDDVDVDGESGEYVLLRTDGVLPVPEQELRVVRQELWDAGETVSAERFGRGQDTKRRHKRDGMKPPSTEVTQRLHGALTNVKTIAPMAA